MAEAVAKPRPRVALVCGNAAGVAPLRDLLAPAAEVVYAEHAAAFDIDRVRELGAAAVLVSLDGGDWLEPLADRADAAGVRLVFDDPSISCALDGWARARWLRHLAAKFAGSSDYDPPRPAAAATSAGVIVVEPAAAEEPAGLAALAEALVAEPVGAIRSAAEGSVFEGSVFEDAGDAERSPAAALGLCKEGDMVEGWKGVAGAGPDGSPLAAQDGAPMAGRGELAADAATADLSAAPADSAESLELDPDTAALSALIDSQLAEPAGTVADGSTGVWRVPPAGNAASGHPDLPAGATSTASADAAAHRRPRPVSDPVDESEVLKGLPSVDDWQLVDPGAPEASVPKAKAGGSDAPASIDIAGLALMPMEDVAVIERHSDPIERWMDTAERVTAAASAARKQRPRKDGSDS